MLSRMYVRSVIKYWCFREITLKPDGKDSPNPVAAMDDGSIIVGFIEPPIKDGGPVPELLIDDDCGIKSVEDVWERLDGPRLP